MRGGITIRTALALALVGCGPTLGVRGQLMHRAMADVGCERATHVWQLAENAFEVDLCGVMVEYTDALAGSERVFVPMTPAATLAAADTQCDVDSLSVESPRGPTHRAFRGCGMRASYALVCMDEGGCHWEREGAPTMTSAALPTAAPAPPDSTPIPPAPGAP